MPQSKIFIRTIVGIIMPSKKLDKVGNRRSNRLTTITNTSQHSISIQCQDTSRPLPNSAVTPKYAGPLKIQIRQTLTIESHRLLESQIRDLTNQGLATAWSYEGSEYAAVVLRFSALGIIDFSDLTAPELEVLEV